jgi:hypothetical protein
MGSLYLDIEDWCMARRGPLLYFKNMLRLFSLFLKYEVLFQKRGPLLTVYMLVDYYLLSNNQIFGIGLFYCNGMNALFARVTLFPNASSSVLWNFVSVLRKPFYWNS